MFKSRRGFDGPIYAPAGLAPAPWRRKALVVAGAVGVIAAGGALLNAAVEEDAVPREVRKPAASSTQTFSTSGAATPGPQALATAPSSSAAAAHPSPTPVEPVVDLGPTYAVLRVVDGDTIHVDINGVDETVRFIGVNTPETVDPNKDVECFGPQASAFAGRLLEGASVHLVRDGGQDNRDQYDRLLRFVYLEDGTNVSRLLVRRGFATYEEQYPVKQPWRRELERAQGSAIARSAGLWRVCQ